MGHGGHVNKVNGGERVGRGEEGSGADPGERRRGRGSERGEWERGPRERGRWRPYPLAGFTAGEGVRRGRPLFRPRSGEQGRGRGGVGDGLGRLGRGSAQSGQGSSGGGEGLLPFFFFLCLCSFAFSFYLFIFFSVLFHLIVFRYFIKMCFLHHNYQCII